MRKKARRIFVAPLDWGLGHATRCIPVIRAFLNRGHEVIIGGTGPHADLLMREFPGCTRIPLVNYGIKYSGFAMALAIQFPMMVQRVFESAAIEHRQMENIIRGCSIDLALSDQRFGCYSRLVPSIIISHQLHVKMPLVAKPLEWMVWSRMDRALRQYHRLWIPDIPGENNYAGDLCRAYPVPENHRYVGLLSRFSGTEPPAHDPGLFVMISGPEPQRSILEAKVRKQLRAAKRPAVVLLGKADNAGLASIEGPISYYGNLDTSSIGSLLRSAETVICRGGYSTIMELASLGKKAILVPTPGQTEQEYLCRRLHKKKRFIMQTQGSLNITRGIEQLRTLNYPEAIRSDHLLDEAVDEALSLI